MDPWTMDHVLYVRECPKLDSYNHLPPLEWHPDMLL